jgi:leucine dehydrogenase
MYSTSSTDLSFFTYNELMKKTIHIETIATPGYKKVLRFHDQATGLLGFISIHNTFLRPALGGTRLWAFPNEASALQDCLRLAQGMTYKAAAANLNLGGGKAVLIGDASKIKSHAYFQAYGEVVDSLAGDYITAEDVNTTTEDMKYIAMKTRHVVGQEEKSGNPSPWTSFGVFQGLLASIQFRYGHQDLKKVSLAIQGVGQTGYHILKLLIEAGAKTIFVSDLNPANLHRVKQEFPLINIVDESALMSLPVDVFIPCALGGILHDTSIATLQAKIIAGSANNILLDPSRHGPMLAKKGILVAPDFVINAGGLINVYHEWMKDYKPNIVREEIKQIASRLTAIFSRTKQKNNDPFTEALNFVQEQLK